MTEAGPHHRSPVSQKSPKRSSTPKSKGAVRAKSGCYTCRIRRKKCDERPDPDGNCQTCVRLRLECLGFGAKRPDWMRENNSVSELRDRIKNFLAAQGMIKGHSGSGPRCAEPDPSVLHLSVDAGSSTPSPQTRPLSASSGDSPRASGPATSYVRDGAPPYPSMNDAYDTLPTLTFHHSASPNMSHQQLSPDSPMSRSGLSHDVMLPSYAPPHMLHPLVPNSSSNWISVPAHIKSSFGSLYQSNFLRDVEPADLLPTSTDLRIPSTLSPALTEHGNDLLVKHYMTNVLQIQYILADYSSIKDFILRLAQHQPVYSAMCFLASVHRHRMASGHRLIGVAPQTYEEERVYHDDAKSALTKVMHDQLREQDAMAALHCISSFLFSGGRGPWDFFLNVACQWVQKKFCEARYHNILDVHYDSTESERFIMRTTMWFDVIASVTLCRQPHFLAEYRELFGPGRSYIDDPLSDSDSFSMLSIMGCDNQTFLAIAEISALAEWKEQQTRNGRLSAPELVRRGQEIERTHLCSGAYDAELVAHGYTEGDASALEFKRKLTANVFRASARVYLHSVLSGDFPGCYEIAEGVRETIAALKRIPAESKLNASRSVGRSVVRSVVFPICIAGCLTADTAQRQFLLQKLQEQEGESVGNCTEVQRLIETVGVQRTQGRSVSWRSVMKGIDSADLLLV